MTTLRYILLSLAAMLAVAAAAQRRITPVANPENRRPEVETPVVKELKPGETPPRPASVIEQRDVEGRVVLVDTVTGKEYHDSIPTKQPRTVYPRLHAVTMGVNLWDGLARIAGQDYGVGGVWAELSLYNWLKPYVELGLGTADYKPKDESYHYKSALAPYFKLGLNYNFLYRSETDYSAYAGLRYGFSSFSYEVVDVAARNSYWGETTALSVPSQDASVGYLEVLFGLRVRIWRDISLGWEIRMHRVLHQGAHQHGDPWYVPGYGTDGSTFSGAFSISYTLPLSRSPKPAAAADVEK